MTPYYEGDGITLYHADARDVLPLVRADVLVTDPPYGINLGVGTDKRTKKHGLAKEAYDIYDDTYENYVDTVVPIVADALRKTKRGAVFSGPNLQELPKASAVGGIYCDNAAGRHQWGFKSFLPVLLYGVDPLLHKGARPNVIRSTVHAEPNGHPCPKPIGWMRWAIDLASLPGEVILDPFAGSGTTLRAAKDLGRPAIGIEIDERYCEITATRLAQGVLNFEEAS